VRVLIVEDDEIFCQFLTEILESKEIEVVRTTDGLAGYEKAWAFPYDLYILDVRMPGLLGSEIAEALKQKNPGAKIILISAFADEALRQTAASIGAPLLSKPFSADELFQTIDKAKSPPKASTQKISRT
jgi:DNA-binding response OmpR family regulator